MTKKIVPRFGNHGLNSPAMKAASLLVLLFAITLVLGCGSSMQPATNHPPITITSDQVFNSSMIGQTWTFRNAYGDTTTIDVQAAPFDAAGTQGEHIILHFTKNADRAYWLPGVAQAEDHFLLFHLPSGGWRGVADLPITPQGCPWCNGDTSATLNWHPVDGLDIPYMIVPASATEGITEGQVTQYHWWLLNNINTTDDIANPPDPSEQGIDEGFADWISQFSVTQVNTPVYSGPAIVSHQFERSCGERFCTEERWYFAPGLGIVEIQPTFDGAAVDPNITIKRVQ